MALNIRNTNLIARCAEDVDSRYGPEDRGIEIHDDPAACNLMRNCKGYTDLSHRSRRNAGTRDLQDQGLRTVDCSHAGRAHDEQSHAPVSAPAR